MQAAVALLLLAQPAASTPTPVADPVKLAFEALPVTDVQLLDAAGQPLPFVLRGVEGQVVLPASLCLGEPCAPYGLHATAPIALDANVARVPLRMSRAASVPGYVRLDRGVAVRHAMHDGAGKCRAQLALGGEDPAVRSDAPPPLVYDVEVDCAAIELGTSVTAARFADPPRDFRRYVISGERRPLTLRGPQGLQWTITPLGASSSCHEPLVYGRRRGSRLEIMMVGDGHSIRGEVPPDELGAYSSVHILPTCPGGRGGGRYPARGPDFGRRVTISAGAVLRARDFEAPVATVTRPLRAIVVRRDDSYEVVRWTAGVDYLCRRDAKGDACVPGVFVRDTDVADDVITTR